MENLTKLIRKRSYIKAKLTRFNKYICSLSNTELNLIELELRINNAELLLEHFDKVQCEIEESDDSEIQLDEREQFENEYYKALSQAKTILAPFNSNTNENVHVVESSEVQQSQITRNVVKLPMIKLPQFNGNYDNWLSFFDTFNSIIHSDESLENIQKFHYLKSCLVGRAAEVIQSLELSSDNYPVAWELLQGRFHNRRLIVNNHVSSLFNMPSVTRENYLGLQELLDGLSKHLRALSMLGQPTDEWDTLVIYVVTNKLDPITRKEWEKTKFSNELPTMQELTNFLRDKCRILETMSLSSKDISKSGSSETKIKQSKSYVVTKALECGFCNSQHNITNCHDFLNLPIRNRIEKVKSLKLCLNCLRNTHFVKNCKGSSCRKCNKRHHTLLHLVETNSQSNVDSKSNIGMLNADRNSTQISVSNLVSNKGSSQILLATAIVIVIDKFGKIHHCRCLLDPGSQCNFVTEDLACKLNLNLISTNVEIAGINHVVSNTTTKVVVDMQSRINSYKTQLECFVLPVITGKLPTLSFDSNSLEIPHNITLADPSYYKSGNIDMLLGASIFWDLLAVGQIRFGKNNPILQKTQLGWIISGPLHTTNKVPVKQLSSFHTMNNCLDDQIKQFWEIEECSFKPNSIRSDEEQFCENHFVKNTHRNTDGRFVVKLPLKSSDYNLGNSRNTALKRLEALERKFHKNHSLYLDYLSFLQEYEQLGHMSLVKEMYFNNSQCYYLPHHSVVKTDSTTTKVRVVFDGSCKSDSGISLNDLMMTGPNIQDELMSIVLRFRKHPFVITADVEKMYRQILVDPEHRSLQQILWRLNSKYCIQCYQLNTVTYGTRSAPFLAIRCLHELAYLHIKSQPQAANIILHDFYVDDLITGGASAEEVISIKNQVTDILKTGGFNLRKWTSNRPELIFGLDNRSSDLETLNFSDDGYCKMLGLIWQPNKDVFKYTITSDYSLSVSKRSILSSVAQIFDPLGLLGPVIIIAKILIQNIWKLNLSWDESVPMTIYTKWTQLLAQLRTLNNVEIDRHVVCKNPIRLEVHGFSDASELAYGACVYVRSISETGCLVQLLCAKSRVAPLKRLTIPRLELCGALLLAKLMKKVIDALGLHFDKQYYWTDSTIVLNWLKGSPHKWKVYVANRIGQILELSDYTNWFHVSSGDNPADMLSRGLEPPKLINCDLWWHGPCWLLDDNSLWPCQPNENTDLDILPERKLTSAISIAPTNEIDHLFERYSNLNKLLRIVSYCIRFKTNTLDKANRIVGSVSATELAYALKLLIKIAQSKAFHRELLDLKTKGVVDNKSRLLNLNPFIDSDNIMHPIVLSDKSALTTRIVHNEHNRLLHAGPQALLASLRESYWPLLGRNVVKRVIRNCMKCFRANPSASERIMGNLPESRVTPTRPFLVVGTDYAGPFSVRDRKGRGFKVTKAYICLFVCFATRAIHIELVGDLTTESFIAALRRFIARRGKCSDIYSDNGLNFVGANTEIKELINFLLINTDVVQSQLAGEGINWHFMPPKSPHFGGIFEAGVKSVKYHLKRVLCNSLLTFEEFYTILVQIEACLNSRPMHPISNDPNDYTALTPSHFLIGQCITSLPDYNWLSTPDNKLSRFQYLQKLLQHFWSRWSKDYIGELQSRKKWKFDRSSNLKIGTLVLIKEDNLPPLKWKMGCIVETFPGDDNVVRTAKVQTAGGLYKRSVTKLCVVPTESSD